MAPDRTVAVASSTAAIMAHNRQVAVAEAERLLGRAVLPTGAVRAASVPKALAGPALGVPGVSSLVTETSYWRVAEPFSQVSAWLADHAPQGLTSTGTSNGGGPTAADDTVGYGYSATTTSPALVSAQLEIGAAPAGASSTALRVDALVVWVDPRPWPDTATGPRVRATLATGCPASIAGDIGVSNPGADLTASLLPSGVPTAALVCRYNGMDGPNGALPATKTDKLAHVAHLGASGAQKLARVVAGVPISRSVVPRFVMCPVDTGAAAVVVFQYPGRADVDLWVPFGACTLAGNGYILAAGGAIAAQVKLYG
jgi:hypothetical protein